MKYSYVDIAQTSDGDINLTPSSSDIGSVATDIMLASGYAALAQASEFRMKTELGDLLAHENLGTVLDELIGSRNTYQTAETGKLSIMNSLTYGGFINSSDIKIISIPADENTIIYHIEIFNNGVSTYKYDLLLDLENGVRRI
jgi:hypothetical protein